MNCPQCNSANVMFSKKRNVHICEDCGHEFTLDEKVIPLRIFLSYGHDANEELVRRIKADLEKRGHYVWFDKSEIKFGDDWRRSITDGITGSDKFVSFLSKHSTRDPGVCRDEIGIAIGVKKGNIQTILVESEEVVKPPPGIAATQWLDMHAWKEKCEFDKDDWGPWYQQQLAEIVCVIESEESRRFAGEIERLQRFLEPVESDSRIYELFRKGITGRQWLFDAVEKWRSGDRASRLFWLMGAPGTGKSAVAAHLAIHGREVIAVEFCNWQQPGHKNPDQIVRTLAFQIATRLPDYRKFLLDLPEIKRLDRKNSAELFDYLLADPLHQAIDGGRDRCLIVIDGLDEAGDAEGNLLVEMLAQQAAHLPDWVGFVVTSRPESNVTGPLQGLNPFPFETASTQNLADIRDYLYHQLSEELTAHANPHRLVEQIVEKSEGVFLYVERFCHDVRHNHLSLDRPDRFPRGLGGIFHQYFRRQFPSKKRYEKIVEPMLGAIMAAREPLSVKMLQKLFGLRESELRKWLRALGSLFPVTSESSYEVIKPYHKSLTDWLTDEARAKAYFVSVTDGHQLLADFCWEEYCQDPRRMSQYALRHLPVYLQSTERWNELTTVLTDLIYVVTKCDARMVRDLAADYGRIGAGRGRIEAPVRTLRVHEGEHGLWCPWCLAWTKVSTKVLGSDLSCAACGGAIHVSNLVLQCVWQPANPVRIPPETRSARFPTLPKSVHEFADFVLSEADVLASRPCLTFQQAHNQPNESAPHHAAEELLRTEMEPSLWLRWSNKPKALDPCLMTISRQESAILASARSPDGTLLATVSSGHGLKLWHIRNGTELMSVFDPAAKVETCVFSPDGRQVASGWSNGAMRLLDVQTGAETTRIDSTAGAVRACSYAPNCDQIVAAYQDGTARVWDVKGGTELAVLNEHTQRVSAVTFSPDGASIVAVSSNGELLVWNGLGGGKPAKLTGHVRAVTAVAFSPDGATLVSGSEDCSLRIWKTNEWKYLTSLSGHRGPIRCVAFSPNGESIVSGSDDRTLIVWDTEAMVDVVKLKGHTGAVNGCDYSADGRLLISVSADGTARLWDPTERAESHTPTGRSGVIMASAWTANGKLALTGSDDRTVKAWNPQTGQMVGLFPTNGPVRAIATMPKGTGAAVADEDGEVYQLDLEYFDSEPPEGLAMVETALPPIPSGASTNRVFRVTVNSTFSDMIPELDALERCVFPRLRKLCELHGAEFEAMDLRWGIGEEAVLAQSTMSICLDQLQRCADLGGRGMAICLLGDRYGWVPPPTTIPRDIFENIEANSCPADNDLLRKWYRIDFNAVPNEYRLQPRSADYVDWQQWHPVEVELKRIIFRSVTDTSGTMLGLSATHLQIDKTLLLMNHNRVFAYIRSIADLPSNESASSFVDDDPDARYRQDNLKSSLHSHLPPENVHQYQARWDGRYGLTEDHLEHLCEKIVVDLEKAILEEMEILRMTGSLEYEIEAHRIFASDRQRNQWVNEDAVHNICSQLRSAPRHLLALVGAPGSDVSGHTARCIAHLQKDAPQSVIVYRFVGATPHSTDVHALMKGVCKQIANAYGYDEPLPLRYGEVLRLFQRLTKMATAGRPLVVILDSLDQLNADFSATSMNWLPSVLPENVVILVSVTKNYGDENDFCRTIRARFQTQALIEIPPMDLDSAPAILDGWLRQAGRTLQPEQFAAVLDGFQQSCSPLYLRMAFLQAVKWTSYDSTLIEGTLELPSSTQGLLALDLDRLEKNYGTVIVSRAMGYIAASRNGLSQNELLDILSNDRDVMNSFYSKSLVEHSKSPEDRINRLPLAVWTILRADLAAYLIERYVDGAVVMDFFHREVAEAVATRYISDESTRLETHVRLAEYFNGLDYWAESLQSRRDLVRSIPPRLPHVNVRKLVELSYHRLEAARLVGKDDPTSPYWDAVVDMLVDLSFIESKCAADKASDLLRDYDLAKSVHSKLYLEFSSFVGSQISVLRRYPQLTLQQARNQPEGSAPQRLSLRNVWDQMPYKSWFRWRNKPSVSSACRLSLDGHTAPVTACSFSSDGRVVASASLDCTLRIWNVYPGREHIVVTSRGGAVTDCAFSPEGDRLVSCAADGTLTVWDTWGRKERDFTGHSDEVICCSWSPDGARIISASKDRTLRVWDTTGRNEAVVLSFESCDIHDCCWSPDAQFVIAALQDGRVMMWSSTDGAPTLILRGHCGPVLACAYSPDGRYILSASEDETLRVWDAQAGVCLRVLSGHDSPVGCCAFLPDGKYLVSGAQNGVVALWSLDSSVPLGGILAHSGNVRTCTPSPNGLAIMTGGDDCLIRTWDLQALLQSGTLPQPRTPITTLAYSHDGQWLAAGTSKGALRITDTRSFETTEIAGTSVAVTACAYSPDGRQIACGVENGVVSLRDSRSGVVENTIDVHGNAITACAFSPDGKKLATVSSDHTIRITDVTQEMPPLTLRGHTSAVTACAYRKDGRLLISGSIDGSVRLWNPVDGSEVACFIARDHIETVGISPDARAIVAGGSRGLPYLLRLEGRF